MRKTYSRKQFIQSGTQALAGLALAPLLAQGMEIDQSRLKKFGLQLYTLRDVFEKNPKEILARVASFGFKQIESYERSQGICWGVSPNEFKSYLDSLGLEMISSHCDIENNFEQKAGMAASIGMQYLVAAWEGPGKTIDDYKRLAATFNQKAAICKKEGLKFAFHNHSFSFLQNEGQYPQDILLTYTDPDLVDFEMDIYWVVATGQDPVQWFERYPGRFKLCHIKDRVKGSTKLEDTCDLGTGSIDFRSILHVAKKKGMHYYFGEQEHYPNGSSLESARVAAAYLKQLRF